MESPMTSETIILIRQWIRENSDKLTKAEVEAAIRELENDIAKLRRQIEDMPDRY
jgi:hypothetical protein